MFEILYDLILTVLLVLLIWPAHPRATDTFGQKSTDSWFAALLLPLKNIHSRFAPRDRLLLRATRRWLFAAFVAIWIWGILGRNILGLATSPAWLLLGCGLAVVLVGRAMTFWIADRRAKSTEPDGQASA